MSAPAKAVSPLVPFHRAAVGEEEVQAVADVIRSGWLTMGAKTIEFERAFAQYVGSEHAIAVSSCTAALHLALEAIGLRPDDEVLLPTTTFTATGEVVTYLGGRPVLVDIDPATLNLDPADAARRLTPRTRAIIPVHIAGQPCDMDEIQALASRHGLHVIEDAAHCLPSTYRGTAIGNLSEITAFSFYATKTLTTGEGGMVTTNHHSIAERMRVMRLHGIGRDAWKRYSADGSWYYQVLEAGYKYNMTDLQAAIGLVQLAKCDALWAARRRIAERYAELFRDQEALEPPAVGPNRESSWHLYVLRLRLECLRINRDCFIRELKERGVETSVHFIPLHLHPFYQNRYGYRPGDLPQAEREYLRSISLPIYPTMTEEDVDRVASAVKEVVRLSRKTGHPSKTMSEPSPNTRGGPQFSPQPCKQDLPGPYSTFGKRLLDVVASAVGLLLLGPLFLVVAALIRKNSPGPVIFRQVRIGRGGEPFTILKFRSMVMGADRMGPGVTGAGDPRITRIGSILRRFKLDELPQLWNVLKGDMSLVGPRPELPTYVAGYTPEQQVVLSVRPGITDYASLAYRHEEDALSRCANPEQHYREVFLPHKLALNLEYIQRISLRTDLRLILATLRSVPAASLRQPPQAQANPSGESDR